MCFVCYVCSQKRNMEIEADPLHQSQNSTSDEETNRAMTESLVCSGIQSLAIGDETLSQKGEDEISKVVKKKLPMDENDAIIVGKKLSSMADEIDGVIFSSSYITKLLRRISNQLTNEKLNELTQYLKDAAKTIIKNKGGITEGCILVIVVFGYRLVKRYLEHFMGKKLLEFIEHIVKATYEIFEEFGILTWIASIGGWAVLAAWRMDSMIVHQICNGLIRGLWGILGVGAAAAAAFCGYRAISR